MNQYEKHPLMLMEEAFCKDSAEYGAKGWASYFSEEGVVIGKSGTLARGRVAIEQVMETFFSNPNNHLTWKPLHVELSLDETMGFTYGDYHRIRETEEGLVEERGRYMTVWKKNTEGQWLIEADIGN